MKKEYVIFSGSKFTIEWYFNDLGNSSALKYFNGLDRERKLEAFKLFKTMAEMGLILNITNFAMKMTVFMLLNLNQIDFYVFL